MEIEKAKEEKWKEIMKKRRKRHIRPLIQNSDKQTENTIPPDITLQAAQLIAFLFPADPKPDCQIPNAELDVAPFTIEELKTAVARLKPKTVSGLDQIPPRSLL
ncbi:hypothetical protein HHI36_023669 [Cryptolaemus montrouzieri]|uniref:Uncharacterized protein n=1 Tax=Cryptolaemus montrouzieri TaxID=559131 RepID=A0ABD2PHA0_9CUCU